MKRPWLSGWCNPSNPAESHKRCAGRRYGTGVPEPIPCRCDCHKPARTLVTEQAELVDVEYLSPEWYEIRREGVAASEIAAVLGILPGNWSSRFDLWWYKRTGQDSQGESKAMRRGRRYEALILEDFADEHPELHVVPGCMVRNIERPWQMATLDGLAYETPFGEPIAAIEAKTGQRNEWGEPGTDAIPVHYRAQVLWQLDTLGLNVAYLPVLFGDQYAEYIVEYHEPDVMLMREAAQEFLASLAELREPELDASAATLRRLKHLHPDVIDGDAEVPAAAVAQYRAAKRLRDAAEARMRLAESRVRHALGDHRIAVVNGDKVASRSVYDVRERVQTVSAHTVNRITFTRERNAS